MLKFLPKDLNRIGFLPYLISIALFLLVEVISFVVLDRVAVPIVGDDVGFFCSVRSNSGLTSPVRHEGTTATTVESSTSSSSTASSTAAIGCLDISIFRSGAA